MSWSGIRISVAGTIAASAHVLLLAYTTAQTLSADDTHWPVYWIKFLALDFPLSLGVVPLAWIFPADAAGPLHDFANFWWPLGYHGIVGTVWWYIVGAYIAGRLARRRAIRRSGDPKL
jgi:hypothetical protein